MTEKTRSRSFLIGPVLEPTSEWKALVSSLQVSSEDYIVGVDRGVERAKSLKLTLNLQIGDWDGLGYTPSGPTLTLPKEKQRSDLHFALEELKKREFPVYALGFLGGELDYHHSVLGDIAHWGHLWKTPVRLYSPELEVWAIAPQHTPLEIPCESQKRFSLLPWGGATEKVKLKNALYPLKGETLNPGSHGLSNEAKGPLTLEFQSGFLFCYLRRSQNPR